MAKAKTRYECTACGAEYPKWNGRCTNCGAWNTIEEALPEIRVPARGTAAAGRTAPVDVTAQIRELAEVSLNEDIRCIRGIDHAGSVPVCTVCPCGIRSLLR